MPANEDMSATINRITGGLINVILGALILWVGQTTFKHAGILASVDEKLNTIKHQFDDVDQRQDSMRNWIEKVVSDMKESNRSQFTMKDGDKLVAQVRETEQFSADLERKFVDRLNALELKLAALDAQRRDTQDVAELKLQVNQLRNELARAAAQEAQYQAQVQQQYQTGDRFARGTAPVFLPPVENRR